MRRLLAEAWASLGGSTELRSPDAGAKLTPGGASRSFGVEVAKLAGLPPGVVERAQQILRGLEAGRPSPAGPRPAAGARTAELVLTRRRPRSREGPAGG